MNVPVGVVRRRAFAFGGRDSGDSGMIRVHWRDVRVESPHGWMPSPIESPLSWSLALALSPLSPYL
jgi:hypothetical protein